MTHYNNQEFKKWPSNISWLIKHLKPLRPRTILDEIVDMHMLFLFKPTQVLYIFLLFWLGLPQNIVYNFVILLRNRLSLLSVVFLAFPLENISLLFKFFNYLLCCRIFNSKSICCPFYS